LKNGHRSRNSERTNPEAHRKQSDELGGATRACVNCRHELTIFQIWPAPRVPNCKIEPAAQKANLQRWGLLAAISIFLRRIAHN